MRSLLVSALALLLAGPLAADEDALAHVKTALAEGRLKDAVEAARAAVAAAPESSVAHHWLGKAYGLSAKRAALLTKLDLAKKCGHELERAVDLDAGNLDAALDLVTFQAKAPGFLGGSRTRARALAARIGERSPARGHVALGILREEEKDPVGAEREYRAAFALEPHDKRVLNALLDLLVERKRVQEALDVCRAALASDPADAEALANEKELLARLERGAAPTGVGR